MKESWMSTAEVAKVLKISETAVLRLAARGSLPSVWLAGRRLWNRETIRKYAADPKRRSRSRSPRRWEEDGDE